MRQARGLRRPGLSLVRVIGAIAGLCLGCAASTPQRIDALLAPLRSDHAPGAAVMVIRGDEVAYTGAVGLADVERGIPIGPRTAFDIASMSKQFTGMLAILLHEDGRLDYDAPVIRFLPELARFGDRMTVRHLLTHTSGLPDYYDALARGRDAGGWVTNRDALAYLERQGDPVFTPGDRFLYSDAGYEMLALILERVAGMPFADLLKVRILEPLGMNDTMLRDRPDLPVPNRARGYALMRDGFVAFQDHPLDCLAGSGAVNTTLHDLALWDRALATGRLVPTTTLDQTLRPVRLNDGAESPYGFGWFLNRDLWRRRWEHPGSWRGFQALIVRYPDDRLTVILLANRSDIDLGDLADRIVRIEGGLHWLP
ncbi:MAG TPA: serine hydrolase domain-containing protein [Candidatus Polarisedimenticolia bacterium]|nr:serine hydrolase domain-containing protein [Candidatus Polarisedimenticolia bacterium]